MGTTLRSTAKEEKSQRRGPNSKITFEKKNQCFLVEFKNKEAVFKVLCVLTEKPKVWQLEVSVYIFFNFLCLIFPKLKISFKK